MAIGHFKADEAMRKWVGNVSEAAQIFERRWTLLHLRRLAPELARNLWLQSEQFNHACLTGTVGDIELQGGAMVRGWCAAVAMMEESGEVDSAYLVGRDPVSGLTVAIGAQKAAAARVVELYGGQIIHITPDEVATMFASVEGFKSIGAIKQRFPGAELIGRYQEQGT